MKFQYNNNYCFNVIISIFVFLIANCSSSKAESQDWIVEDKKNDTIYELIQLLNPDIIDPEIEKIIQVDTLKETALYFDDVWVKALRSYHQELIAQQELEDYEAQGNIYKKIAYAYSILGVIDREIEYYQYALEAYSKTNNQIATALVFNKLGEAYFKLGEIEEAEKYLEIAYGQFQEQLSVSIQDKIRYYSDIGNNLSFLTRVFLLKGQNDRAIKYADITINSKHKTSARYRLDIGEIYLQTGQTKKVIEYLDPSAKLCETSKSNFRNVAKLNYLAEAYIAEGNTKKAISCYNRVLKTNDKYSKVARADAYLGLSKLYLERENYDKALSPLLKALHIYRQNHSVKNIFKIHEVLRNIGDIDARANKIDKAIIYYEQSLVLALEARYLLLEDLPIQFYKENDLILEKLLLLLQKTEQIEKYERWEKLKNSFKSYQYIKNKYIYDLTVNPEDKKIIEEWQTQVKLLKSAYQQISSNIYSRECKQEINRYNKAKQNLNTLAIQINNRHPQISELLQISDLRLTNSNPNIICKWRSPDNTRNQLFWWKPIF